MAKELIPSEPTAEQQATIRRRALEVPKEYRGGGCAACVASSEGPVS